MKKIFLLVVASMVALSVAAQNSDSQNLAKAERDVLTLPKGAVGYTVKRVKLFNSAQTISVTIG